MCSLKKLVSKILPKAVMEERFGVNDAKFIEYKSNTSFGAEDNFSSEISFGDVILERGQGDRLVKSVMIKTQPTKLFEEGSDLDLTKSQQAKLSFCNECLFYTEILPLLNKCESGGSITKIFPKLLYASVNDINEMAADILIFENVQKYGFKHAQSRGFLDYNHIVLTAEWVGKFHSLSLMCKYKFPGELEKLSSKIRETDWTVERATENGDAFFVTNCKRGILPLQQDPHYKYKLRDLSAVIERTGLSTAKIVDPVEPMAVICHGDFCRNNIFYKYDSDGVPCEVMFFDLAAFRYSSPIIDLSFFLFMHSSPEITSDHWADILETYHSGLTSSIDLDPRSAPTLDDVVTDFRRRGFFGYVRACSWLPVMLLDQDSSVDWWELSDEDRTKLCVSAGGEKTTGYIVKMVQHMIDQNFDFNYIRSYHLSSIKKLHY